MEGLPKAVLWLLLDFLPPEERSALLLCSTRLLSRAAERGGLTLRLPARHQPALARWLRSEAGAALPLQELSLSITKTEELHLQPGEARPGPFLHAGLPPYMDDHLYAGASPGGLVPLYMHNLWAAGVLPRGSTFDAGPEGPWQPLSGAFGSAPALVPGVDPALVKMMEGSPRLASAFAQLLSGLAQAPALTSLELSFPAASPGLPPGTAPPPPPRPHPPQLAIVGGALRLPRLRRLVLCADQAFFPPMALRRGDFCHLPALTCLELRGHWEVGGRLRLPPTLRRLAVPFEVGDEDSRHWGPYREVKQVTGLEELGMEVLWLGGPPPRTRRRGGVIWPAGGGEGAAGSEEEGSEDDDSSDESANESPSEDWEGGDESYDDESASEDAGAYDEWKGLDLGELGYPWGIAPQLRHLAIDLSHPAASGRNMELYGSCGLPQGLRSLTIISLGRSEFRQCPGYALWQLSSLERLALLRCDARAEPRASGNYPPEPGGLSPGLSTLTALTSLDLNGCVGSIPSLTPLRSLPRLRAVSLAGCNLQRVPANELLAGWPALQDLRLEHAALPPPGALLASELAQPLTRLELDVRQAAALAPMLAAAPALQRLDVHLFLPQPAAAGAPGEAAASAGSAGPRPGAESTGTWVGAGPLYANPSQGMRAVAAPAAHGLPALATLGLPVSMAAGRAAIVPHLYALAPLRRRNDVGLPQVEVVVYGEAAAGDW